MTSEIEIKKIKKKIVILGEGGVGKTTLLHRYVNNIFVDSTKMTIGTDFFIKKVRVLNENVEYELTLLIWDFAGQERFRFILNEYINGAEGIILAFDLSRVATLYRIKNWIGLISIETHPISKETIEEFKQIFKSHTYHETSALDDIGIEDFFNYLALSMIE